MKKAIGWSLLGFQCDLAGHFSWTYDYTNAKNVEYGTWRALGGEPPISCLLKPGVISIIIGSRDHGGQPSDSDLQGLKFRMGWRATQILLHVFSSHFSQGHLPKPGSFPKGLLIPPPSPPTPARRVSLATGPPSSNVVLAVQGCHRFMPFLGLQLWTPPRHKKDT